MNTINFLELIKQLHRRQADSKAFMAQRVAGRQKADKQHELDEDKQLRIMQRRYDQTRIPALPHGDLHGCFENRYVKAERVRDDEAELMTRRVYNEDIEHASDDISPIATDTSTNSSEGEGLGLGIGL